MRSSLQSHLEMGTCSGGVRCHVWRGRGRKHLRREAQGRGSGLLLTPCRGGSKVGSPALPSSAVRGGDPPGPHRSSRAPGRAGRPRPIPPPLPGLHPPPWAKPDLPRVPAFTPQSPPHRQHPLPGYCHPAPRCHLLKEPSTAPRLPRPPISSEQAFPLTVYLPMGMCRLISRALGRRLAGHPPGPEGRLLPSSLA